VVRDGTNRVEILEFRLVELEGGDVSNISETSTLGTVINLDDPIETATNAVAPEPELAVGEKADFDAASEALESGDYEVATNLFERFTNAYPDSPSERTSITLSGTSLLKNWVN
jgi:TolA-binding protein